MKSFWFLKFFLRLLDIFLEIQHKLMGRCFSKTRQIIFIPILLASYLLVYLAQQPIRSVQISKILPLKKRKKYF